MVKVRKRRRPLRWVAAVVLVLLVVFVVVRHAQSPAKHSVEKGPLAPTDTGGLSPAGMQVAKLADFSLPPYVAPHSGAATASGEFATGMKAYRRGDCANAVAHLSRMSTGQDDEVTARFYAAACQLAAHDLAAATKNLWRVTGDIESPQYEAAHYYLAQLMLARGDVVAARQYLRRTADMQGDYASRARAELAKLQNLH